MLRATPACTLLVLLVLGVELLSCDGPSLGGGGGGWLGVSAVALEVVPPMVCECGCTGCSLVPQICLE